MNVRSNAIRTLFLLLCSNYTWGRYLPEDHSSLSTHRSGRARRIRLHPRSIVNELTDYNEKQAKLQKLLQQIYQAESSRIDRLNWKHINVLLACGNVSYKELLEEIYILSLLQEVKKETLEVKRLQGVVAAADRELEEASNQVRTLSADLQEAQRLAAQRALKSHSEHLQLSAHDQLMFTSRQRVDALSAQAIAAQAEIGMWPGAGMYYNMSLPFDQGEHQEQILGPVYSQEMIGGYGKAPIMYRNAALQQPQLYPMVSNGFQFVPVEAA